MTALPEEALQGKIAGHARRHVLGLRFWRDERGASAVEFALVSGPFVFLVLALLQVGVYYMTQSSLDAGVIKTADSLRNNFNQAGTPTMPNAATLKAQLVANSGGLIKNTSTLKVEIQPVSALASAAVAITDATNNYGGTRSALALRAENNVVGFIPGMSTLFGKVPLQRHRAAAGSLKC